MSVPLLVETYDLESCIGPAKLAQLLSEDGSETPRAERLQNIMQAGSDAAAGALMPGFTTDELVGLVRRDSYIRRLIAWWCVGMAAEGRSEFVGPEGQFVFDGPYLRAMKELRDVGERQIRSIAEHQNGTTNKLIGLRVDDKPRYRRNEWVFSDTARRQGSGGF